MLRTCHDCIYVIMYIPKQISVDFNDGNGFQVTARKHGKASATKADEVS